LQLEITLGFFFQLLTREFVTELHITHSACSPAEVVNFLPNGRGQLCKNYWRISKNLPSFKVVGWTFSPSVFLKE